MSFNPNIKHVFVLMLENRSFDHMLAFSGIQGIEAATTGNTNDYPPGTPSHAGDGATPTMLHDPGHEFTDVLEQLTGAKVYKPDGSYPDPDNSGFVKNYATTKSKGEGGATGDFGVVMQGYSSAHLPVMNQLAREFALCDHWYASMPGPTWPNRFFVHAASSGGLDHSPTTLETALLETIKGYSFQNGTIYDMMRDKGVPFQLYRGAGGPLIGSIPTVAGLKGITLGECRSFDHFANDVAGDYPYAYTFIEPNYGNIINGTFSGGSSQHPMDDVRGGELLIKKVYETIRNTEALWEKSLLLVLYDEHGGFYDHVPPPAAVPPGDKTLHSHNNSNHFLFDRLGVRVPALVISAYTPKGIVSKTPYEHSCVPVLLKELFNLPRFLTARDKGAASLADLAGLEKARTDCPPKLAEVVKPEEIAKDKPGAVAASVGTPDSSPVDGGNLPGFLHVVMKADAEKKALEGLQHGEFLLQVTPQVRTRGEARAYMESKLMEMETK